MALALYRRYRPDTFEGVVGQDQVTVPLMRALDEGKLTHAYLFSGPRGCGKTSSARILARCVNCAKGPTSHPCGECESCRDLATGGPGSIDVVEIDAASHNGVDDARELRDRVAAMPARDRYKIFILDEAHMVTPQGFNALLKTVEEPPDHVMFIFATTEPDKVIGTIRSRTHHYPFRLVPAEVMGPYLETICGKEGIRPEPGVLRLAMRAGGGSVRDTLSVLDQLMVGAVDGVITQQSAVALLGFTPDALIGEAVDAVIDRDGEALYGVVQKVVVGGYDPRRFVEDLLARVRDLLVLTLGGARAESVLGDDAAAGDMDDLKRQSAALGLTRLTGMADVINDALGSMSGATSPRMRLELLAARLLAGPLPQAAADGSVAPSAAQAGPAAAGSSASTGAGTPGGHVGFAGSSRAKASGGFAGSSRHAQDRPADGGTEPAQAMQSAQTAQAEAGAPGSPTAASAPGTPSTAPADAEPAGWGAPASAAVSATAPVATSVATSVVAEPAVSGPAEPGAAQSGDDHHEPDRRTPDERWDALVAALPDDVARYVRRDKVPRIHLTLNEQTGAGKLWIKFDVPLSKYAFAIAMADETVDGTNRVVDILRAETRKAFGEHVQLAPTEKMADGQVAPPMSKLPPDEQRRIKSQIAMANAGLAAAGLAASIGMASAAGPAGSAADGAAKADAGSGASDGDDVHRGMPHPGDDVDPWAQPPVVPVAPATPVASAAASAGREGNPQEHDHARHVAVPDLSDDVDPWAQPPVGAARPAAEPVRPASAPSPAPASSSPVPASHAFADEEDPWAQPRTPQPQQAPRPAPQPEPRNAGGPQPQHDGGPQPGGWQPPDDPFTPPTMGQPPRPQVDAEDDEYSLSDASLGQAAAMSLDDIKRMFEVKKVEEFAADDPNNPANAQHKARETE
ncbi:DNA polymerase III subunit gamma/tau [Bifidobacterium sp. DSM 109958]|uniref:DNA-directed DNA polymerase n=1 Tax=Bifidobacterium moraviense TaxID=2675323 RepID=A0A7Y0HZU2_9BIFI|nr:DNA polymerase III subunit gamma/tau [Bifidobacterium sp. DSM 109958]NMN00580.1 DNA polymerase III subunit gamma/tau [Bifidobacterium sp. DSM 109958]